MSPDKDKFLCDTYPEIFKNRHSDMKTTAMCWGFECGDGWFILIDELCNNIKEHVKRVGCGPVVATQVKEKFGTLRFYIQQGDDYIYDLILEAEEKSSITCEICGKPGKTNNKGLLATGCVKHNKE